MRCLICEKICKHPRSVSWREYQLCSDCMAKHGWKLIPYIQSTFNYKDRNGDK